MANFLGFELSWRPKEWARSWGLAFANAGRGFVDMFSNKRLWVGLAVSVVIHTLFFLLTSGVFKGNMVKRDDDVFEVSTAAEDESLPPAARKLIQQQQFVPGPASAVAEEAAPIDLTQRATFQADMSNEEFSLDQSSTFSGEVLRLNSDATVSTAEILSQAPIDLKRGTGGIGRQNPFDEIAAGNASALDLETKSASIGSEAIKVKETAPVDVGKEAASSGAQTSGFTISGDLTRADLLKYQMPGFPSWAKQKGLSNVNVTISISVDASGNVQPTMIVRRSSGYPQWDDSVKSTLRGWKFKPAQGGIRRGNITFTFILR